MPRRWARTIERACCAIATYIPLTFVYGLTTWAIWVVVKIGSMPPKGSWLGTMSSAVGVVLYLLLNWCYTTAVFTDPGSTTNSEGYGLLPTSAQKQPPATTASLTVKSNGEMRFCKKCQARKPDRAHHCSTCHRCVLKMDHHCPWLATCLGLRNYKAFLLFLVYTTMLCLYAFAVSGTWVWAEVIEEEVQQLDAMLPVNFIVLSILSGIIGLVVGIFTGWHVMLALKGQTTIECLEKTRYLSPLKQPYRAAHNPALRLPQSALQFVDFHTNALPGITRPEEGEERRPSNGHGPRPAQLSYEEHERLQSRRRYEEYLDEQDSARLPSAFDLGWRRNLRHLLGPQPWLWALPICNTTGDGWSWEASPKWLDARDRIQREREEQRAREVGAGWGIDDTVYPSSPSAPLQLQPSKADRVLGRAPDLYADGSQGMRMHRLSTHGKSLDDDDDDDDDLDLFDTDVEENTPDPAPAHAHVNVNNAQSWTRGGASGVLRNPALESCPRGASLAADDDDGVD